MYFWINVVGLLIFVGIGYAFSKRKGQIQWVAVLKMLVLNLVIAYVLTRSHLGRELILGAANGFNTLVQVAYEGIAFALPDWVQVKQMNFVTSTLLPILMIIPLFDILTYVGILPWIVKWVGKILSKVTGQPKFESFFAVEMMFLGNTEALAVSKLQLKQMNSDRVLTLAMMSMSCVTASIIGAYTQMMPKTYILTAIPVNVLNAIIVTNLLNPVSVTPQEDTIAKIGSEVDQDGQVIEQREPFFAFLGDSILNAGKLVLIIAANVIAFVALAALVNKVLQVINPWLTLEHILGVIMFPFAWLLGVHHSEAFELAQYMGTKLVTNEFVVMGQVSDKIKSFSPHYQAVLTVFVTSFANFSTVGMIIGAFKGLVDKSKNDTISKNVGYMLLSGVLVSLLSAAIVGLFIW